MRQATDQRDAQTNCFPNTAPATKNYSWVILVSNETSSTMRGATDLQLHQILRLPRKINLMIDPPLTWNVIYNARSKKSHPPTSPNTAPATNFWVQDISGKSLNCFRQYNDDSSTITCRVCIYTHMQIILHIGPNKHWSILYYELTPKEHDICGFEWYLYVCVSRCIAWTLWRRLKNPWRHCHSLRAHVVTQTGLCHAILSTRAQWVGCSLKNSKRECATMCHKYGYPCFRQFGNGQKRLGYWWMETHKFTSAFLSWETSMKNFVQVCRSVFLGAHWKDVWLIEIWCYQKKYELHDFRYCCLLLNSYRMHLYTVPECMKCGGGMKAWWFHFCRNCDMKTFGFWNSNDLTSRIAGAWQFSHFSAPSKQMGQFEGCQISLDSLWSAPSDETPVRQIRASQGWLPRRGKLS